MIRRPSLFIALLGALALLSATLAAAQDLPLPRFASMRNAESNVRTGPGTQYPIDWVFVRQGMPVEIVQEFDNWRMIRDREGVGGWVHSSQLSGLRTAIVTGDGLVPLLAEPRSDAGLVARIETGVIGTIVECPLSQGTSDRYCHLEMQGHDGWVAREHIWGVYATEAVE